MCQQDRRANRGVFAIALAALAFGFGCATETHEVGPKDIKFDLPKMEKVGVMRIWRNDKQVGWLEECRLIDDDNDDRNDRYQSYVLDMNRQKLGFITDDMRAFRYRAHYAPELVANHPQTANDVMAIFGWNDGTVHMTREQATDQ